MSFIRITSPLRVSPPNLDEKSCSWMRHYVLPTSGNKSGHVVSLKDFLAALRSATSKDVVAAFESNARGITAVIIEPSCCQELEEDEILFEILKADKRTAVSNEHYEYAAVLHEAIQSLQPTRRLA